MQYGGRAQQQEGGNENDCPASGSGPKRCTFNVNVYSICRGPKIMIIIIITVIIKRDICQIII